MKQIILPDDYDNQEIFQLDEKDSHYLLNVQRKEIGYKMNFLDKEGNRYNGTIIDIENKLCLVKLIRQESEKKKTHKLILLQGIPKGKKIDLMIRQSVEIGVSNFYPITADHSIPVFKTNEERSKKHKRWEKIIKEASQQSGTNYITKLEEIQSLENALKNIKRPYTGIFFHQVPLNKSYMHKILENAEENIVLVIGPEGGISSKEVELLQNYNFTPCLLGDNILRAETATTFALGAVQMMLLERDVWNTNN